MPPEKIPGSDKYGGAASASEKTQLLQASLCLLDDDPPFLTPDFGNPAIPDVTIFIKHCIQQRLFEIVLVWFLLMWLPGVSDSLLLAPALGHGDNECDVITSFR